MYSAPTQSDLSSVSPARFGHSHGYRIEGDAALLSAHIDVAERAADTSFALQLWACDEPYGGGPLAGFKIAEAPIALANGEDAAHHDALAFARPPAAARDYSMVLVLAAGQQGAFDRVYDFANYPRRERFLVPELSGSVTCSRSEDGKVQVQAERVINPRDAQNLSGSLALQLWSCAEPYRGGALEGTLLGSWELGQLRGQDGLAPDLSERVPAPSATHLVLALCEWTAQGYLARDYRTFAQPQEASVAPQQRAFAEPQFAAPQEASVTPEPAKKQAPPAPATVGASASVAPEPAKKQAPPPAPAAVSASATVAPEPAKKQAPPSAPAAVSASASASVAPEPAKKQAPPSAQAPDDPSARLSLNRASEAQLVEVLGISAKLAAQLIKARPFKSFDQLLSLRGIGDKTVHKVRKLFEL